MSAGSSSAAGMNPAASIYGFGLINALGFLIFPIND